CYVQTDASGAQVKFNKERCIVIARIEVMGPDAIKPTAPTGTPQIVSKVSGLEVYPNPTTGLLNIHLSIDNSSNAIVHVYDMKGSLVRIGSKTLHTGENTITIDLNNLPQGVYNANVSISGKTYSAKIIKK